MGTLFFIIKSVAATALVILLMQIHWGPKTIEQHTLHFIRSSSLIEPIESTASSAIFVVRDLWAKTKSHFSGTKTSVSDGDGRIGHREVKFHLERSKEYLQKKAKESKKTAQQTINRFVDETKYSSEQDLTSEEEDTN